MPNNNHNESNFFDIIYIVALFVSIFMGLYLSFSAGRMYEREIYRTSYEVMLEHLDRLDNEMCELGKQMYGNWWSCE